MDYVSCIKGTHKQIKAYDRLRERWQTVGKPLPGSRGWMLCVGNEHGPEKWLCIEPNGHTFSWKD